MLAAAVSSSCSRWQPARTYEVTSQGEPQERYAAVLEVVNAEKYTVISSDPARYRLQVEAKASSSKQKSFIDIEVVGGSVRLVGSGHLVRNGKLHKSLHTELVKLEQKLGSRLGPTPAASGGASSLLSIAGPPEAWSEPASDQAVWGSGNFTCLPVHVPAEHQAALKLRLSNGDNADVQLSLAYAPELCRSPQKCRAAGGCPALGIGDSERVNKLAARIKKGEVSGRATLFDGNDAVSALDLGAHGSIKEALSEMKR
ncbi:MAG TPA: hypothetical protein VGK73_11945 [Polyangiaceae bacterium]